MRGGSCYSPNASGRSLGMNRLLVGIGRIFKPTRSGTGSFARSHHAHASGQDLPFIRTLLENLHHGSQARLRTFPDMLGDRGFYLPRFKVGKPGSRVRGNSVTAAPSPKNGTCLFPGMLAQAFLTPPAGRGFTTTRSGRAWSCLWQLGCRSTRFAALSVPP